MFLYAAREREKIYLYIVETVELPFGIALSAPAMDLCAFIILLSIRPVRAHINLIAHDIIYS